MVAYLVNRDRVAWRVVDDEAVIIHSETSDYFSLNRSGTWLWNLMDLPRSRNDLAAALSARYGRPAGEASADVDAYLEHLVTAGLLLHDTEAAAIAMSAGSADAAAPRDGYEAPQVVKFGNLETLILSGE
jgi:hypothetical protein